MARPSPTRVSNLAFQTSVSSVGNSRHDSANPLARSQHGRPAIGCCTRMRGCSFYEHRRSAHRARALRRSRPPSLSDSRFAFSCCLHASVTEVGHERLSTAGETSDDVTSRMHSGCRFTRQCIRDIPICSRSADQRFAGERADLRAHTARDTPLSVGVPAPARDRE